MAETMTLTTVLIDISTISTLLFVGFLIRQKIPFFYKYYIPTSLIAGIFRTAPRTSGPRTVLPDPPALQPVDLTVDKFPVRIYLYDIVPWNFHRKIRT